MTNRPRKTNWTLGCFLMLCTVSACDCDDDDRPPDEVYTWARPVDFDDYKTFRINDDLDEEDLEDAGVDIDDFPEDVKFNLDIANDQARIELEALGLTEVDEGVEADLVVASLGNTKENDAIVWECVPGSWWGYWGWYWDDCAYLEADYVEWTVGTVALGLGDPKMEKVVFGGLLQGVADGDGDTEERIRDGVHKMFEEYPEQPED